jgi:hypothetical protein
MSAKDLRLCRHRHGASYGQTEVVDMSDELVVIESYGRHPSQGEASRPLLRAS